MEANERNKPWNKPWNEQRLIVTGFIEFSTMNNEHLDGVQLRLLIKQVDDDHPWVSYYEGGEGGQLAPSIRIGYADEKVQNDFWNRSYTIKVLPPFWLKPDQFYAFNRHMVDLVEKLSALAIEGVHNVRCWLNIRGGGGDFMTPAAQERLEETMRQPGFLELKALFEKTPRPTTLDE